MFGFAPPFHFPRAGNPYPSNIIINPSFEDGSTNWNVRTPTNGSAVIQNNRLEFTATSVVSNVTLDTSQTIPDGNYTVYVEVEHVNDGQITAFETISQYPSGGTQAQDTFTGSGTTIISGTVGFIFGGSGNLTVDLQTTLTGLFYINSIYLVPQ